MFPLCFEVFLQWKRGPRVNIWSILGSSKNDPKSIAICLGTLINHFGIIKTPKNPKNTVNNLEKQKHA